MRVQRLDAPPGALWNIPREDFFSAWRCHSMRLIRSWFERPSVSACEITERLDAVEELAGELFVRADLRKTLDRIYDLERTCGRIGYRTAGPRDLLALASSLEAVADLLTVLDEVKSPRLLHLAATLDPVREARRIRNRQARREGQRQ